jgi:uncharacterized membrane protein YkgB
MQFNLISILQLVIAFGLLNVWLIRFNKATAYRGGNARSMKEEFQAYGLPVWFVYVIGFLKITAALGLIAGLWEPRFTTPSAILVGFLMLGALAMHFKIKDSLKKSVPAAAMLILSLGVLLGTNL